MHKEGDTKLFEIGLLKERMLVREVCEMKTLEQIKRVIDRVEELEKDYIRYTEEVITYAELWDEYQYQRENGDMENVYRVFDQACERINSEYIPRPEHIDDYTGGLEIVPVTFDEIKRLYVQWGMDEEMSFQEFFETWQ